MRTGRATRSFGLDLVLLLLVGVQLAVSLQYARFQPLHGDELGGAHLLVLLETETPFVDFTPYKTVLGYGVQLLLLESVADSWTALLVVRSGMAVLTAVGLLAASLWLRRRVGAPAAILSLAILVSTTTLLERCFVLRVDMMAALLGLATLVALVARRPGLAGGIAALGFFVSQKGALAILGALAVLVSELRRRDATRTFGALARFVGAAGLVSVVYFAILARFDGLLPVLRATFLDPTQLEALAGDGPSANSHIWRMTLSRNPLFWFASGLSVAWLLLRPSKPGSPDRRIAVFVLVVGGVLLSTSQVWHYGLPLLILPLWIALAFGLSRWLRSAPPLRQRVVAMAVLVLGLTPPWLWTTWRLGYVDLSQQREHYRLLDRIVGPDDVYFAGRELLYRRSNHLGMGTSNLSPYLPEPVAGRTGGAVRELLRRVEAAPLAAVLVTEHLEDLPPEVVERLFARTVPVWGNLRVAAVPIGASTSRVHVPVAGTWRVLADPDVVVIVEGRTMRSGDRIPLTRGAARARAGAPASLVYFPDALAEAVERSAPPLRPSFFHYAVLH